MKIAEMNWGQVADYLKRDDRAVLPIGCTEQHAFLSLSTDSILAEKVSLEAAEPLGVPVFPVVPYGITPSFLDFPGTVSIRIETYLHFIRDILDSLAGHGFRRVLVVNGHGGNSPAQSFVGEWMSANPDISVKFHNWWNAPETFKRVLEIDSLASHASWMENFPWTRLAGVVQPTQRKPMVDIPAMRLLPPSGAKTLLGDGNFGGYYERADDDMLSIWDVAVSETRKLLEGPWPER